MRAALGQIESGMGGYRRGMEQSTRSTGFLNNQMKALGTTMRYAFAGSVTYGVFNLVKTLEDTQRQLALIDFLGSFTQIEGGAKQADAALTGLYHNSQRAAVEALTPVNDFNESLINLYSTVQNLNPDKAVKLTTVLAEGSQLAQVQTDELTKAVSSMQQAYGRAHTQKNYESTVRGFTTLISRAPGGASAGEGVIQQLGPLSAAGRLANVKPSEIFGLYTSELRFGNNPAQGGRGLQYLLQSIASPTGVHAKALAEAGVTPQWVQDHGGLAAIQKVIAHTRKLGLKGNLKAAAGTPDETLDQLDSSGRSGTDQVASLGVSGQGIQYLSKAIGRIHGVRALIALMAQQQTGSLKGDLDATRVAMQDTEKATKDFKDQWTRFASKQPLKGAAISLDVIRRQIGEAIAPAVNLPAKGLTSLVQRNTQNPWAVRGELAGGAAAAFAAYRLLGRSRVAGVGRGLPVAGAAIDLMQHGVGHERGSAGNPMYVVVLNQLFGGRNRAGIPNTDLRRAEGELGGAVGAGRGGAAAAKAARFSKFRSAAIHASYLTGFGLVGDLAAQTTKAVGGYTPFGKHHDMSGTRRISGTKGLDMFIKNGKVLNQWGVTGHPDEIVRSKAGQEAMKRRMDKGMSAQEAYKAVMMHGKASVDVNITQSDSTGKVTHRKKAHVALDLFPGFTTPAPQQKAKPKSHRGGSQ